MCVYVCVCVCTCVHACVCLWVCACVCICSLTYCCYGSIGYWLYPCMHVYTTANTLINALCCMYIEMLSSSHPLLTQDWSPLMCSLVDQVPQPKETQLSRVQLYSAGPAELLVQEPVVEVSCILPYSRKFWREEYLVDCSNNGIWRILLWQLGNPYTIIIFIAKW